MTPGAVGAIVGARRARERARAGPRARATVALDERDVAALRKDLRIASLFAQYDSNKSGKLGPDQLRRLLADTDVNAWAAPSDEEVDFVLLCGDRNRNGGIDRDELEQTLRVWYEYVEHRHELAEALANFDKSCTGKLDRFELQEYLESLGADKVTERDVERVLCEADVFRDGAIRQTELGLATAAWRRRSLRKAQMQRA